MSKKQYDPETRMPLGFWKLDDAWTDGQRIVVFGCPPSESELDVPEETYHELHNCDVMGCGSLDHAILIVYLEGLDQQRAGWTKPETAVNPKENE